jgi:hypothetical protein
VLALFLAMVLASTICFVPLGQLFLLFLGQGPIFFKLVVMKGLLPSQVSHDLHPDHPGEVYP